MKRLNQSRGGNPARQPSHSKPEYYDISGDGYLTDLINKLPSSDSSARPMFSGEKHMVLKLKNGRSGMANYMGPGTHVIDRVRRGDPGRTPADMVAKRHDIDFTLAQEASNKKEQIKLARQADKRMVKSLRDIQKGKHGGDSFRNIQSGLRGIESKMALENRGLLNPSRFAGELVKHNPADSAMLKKERSKLTQQGYGMLPGAGLKSQVMKKLKRDRMKKNAVSQTMKMSGKGLTLPGGEMLSNANLLKFITKDMLPNLLKSSGLSKIPMKTIAPVIGSVLKISKGKNLKGLAQNLSHAIIPLMTMKHLKMAKAMRGSGLMDSLAFMKKKLNDKMVSAIMGALKMYIGQLGTKGKGLTLPGGGLKLPGQGMCGSGFFSSIGNAFKKVGKSIVSNPLRLAGAIGTLGLSETFLTPAQLLKESTGIKSSQVIDKIAPIVATASGNPELALGSKLTSGVLRGMDL